MKRFFTLALLCLCLRLFSQPVVSHAYSDVSQGCVPFTVQFFDTSTGNPTTYNWNFGDGTTSNLKNPVHTYTTKGNYFAIHTVSNGSTSDSTHLYIVASKPLLGISGGPTSSPTSCNGNLVLTVTGGVSPYHFQWSNGATTQNISNLCGGFYRVTVTDTAGCTAIATGQIYVQGCAFTSSLSTTGYRCDRPGDTVSINLHKGKPPYVIAWEPNDTLVTYDTILTHYYSTNTSHTINMMDSSGCTLSVYDTMYHSPIYTQLLQQVRPPCNNPNSGKLKIQSYGGRAPYTFLWSNGGTKDSITNVPAGTYTVTVTDKAACTASATFALPTASSFFVYAFTMDATCVSDSLGLADLMAVGGKPPYAYHWSTNETNDSIFPSAGTYGYTVTDSLGCAISGSVDIHFSSFSYYVYLTGSLPNCGNNGTLLATVYSGTPPYQYRWSNNQTTQGITALGPGRFTVTVTDDAGCSSTGTDSLQAVCQNVIIGNLFKDTNGNCLPDSGESGTGGIYIKADNGINTYYSSSNANGDYSIAIPDSGTFRLQAVKPGVVCAAFTSCPVADVTFNHLGDTAIRNIGTTAVSLYDLALHPGWSSAQPGFQKEYWVLYYNQAFTAFTGNATITFTYDSNLVYQSSLAPLPVHDPVNHTLTWVVSNVPSIIYTWGDRLRSFFTVPASLPAGYLLQSDFRIEPTVGDCDSTDNHLHFSNAITSSRDPNAKEVSPAGNISNEDSVLTYTIHFQNTGNDTAWFITVRDTLSPTLDPLTVEMVASSHPYQFKLGGTGVLEWLFNPIALPDSTTNPAGSQGFITFNVKKKADLVPGSTISNTASIYFNYNEPVATNTITNTIVVFGSSGISSTAEEPAINIFPNPNSIGQWQLVVDRELIGSQCNIFDASGKLVFNSEITSQNSAIKLSVAPGIYLLQISSPHYSLVRKLIKL